jgi:hypothetical protein
MSWEQADKTESSSRSPNPLSLQLLITFACNFLCIFGLLLDIFRWVQKQGDEPLRLTLRIAAVVKEPIEITISTCLS